MTHHPGFQVLVREVSIVAHRHGWGAAIGSNAFITDLVPGIVMGLLFSQVTPRPWRT